MMACPDRILVENPSHVEFLSGKLAVVAKGRIWNAPR